jgi:hypothetical protein
MTMLTKFLAKLLGLWIVVAVCGMVANRGATITTLNQFFADPPLMWITGIFILLVGLAIVLGHNRWSGGALAVTVTLSGWIALIKGLLFLLLPPPAQAQLYAALHFEQYFYGYFVISLVLGGYLIYGGFTASYKSS